MPESVSQQCGPFPLSCCLSWLAIKWCLSQNCRARGSGTRLSVCRVGRYQSVGNTGSQTTNTRRDREWICSRIRSTAEAPRKQVVQVGDMSSITRTSPTAASNARRNSSALLAVTRVNGGCDLGVRPYCSRKNASAIAATEIISHAARFRLSIGKELPQPAIQFASNWGNKLTIIMTTTAVQNKATDTPLRFVQRPRLR